jgi:methionyl-tRNA formyltransferase
MVICIAGKNDIAVNTILYLKEIDGDNKIVALPSQNDPGIHAWCRSLKMSAIESRIEIIGDISELYDITDLIFLSLEFDKIIDINKFKSKQLYNVHFSLLPKYKGVYTSAWHILNAEKSAGVTLHFIDHNIDTGDIIDQTSFILNDEINCRDLYFLFNKLGAELVKKNIHNLISNKKLTAKRQPSKFSTYYSKSSIDYKNIKIDLQKTAFEINCQIRAFYFLEFQIPSIYNYKVKSSRILKRRSIAKSGSLIEDHSDYFIISTVDYDLKIYKDTLL